MAGGKKSKKRSRKRRKTGGARRSPSTSASSDGTSSDQSVGGRGHGGPVAFPSEVPGLLPDYEWGWHKSLFVGTKANVDIMPSVRNQLLKTCFLCAILYAAEQDICKWLAIEEPDRHPEIYFDFDTYVTQYEAEVGALIGQVVSSVYRTREDRPRNALKIFLRDGVLAYSKSKEWHGGKMIRISNFQFHKDMLFPDFENIIASGGSVIGGFPVGPEFKDLAPDAIYEFSPPRIKRQSAGAHMVQFIGTGIDLGREFLVFLNSKKRFGKKGVGKVYFDQIYSGVYTLECRAPPPPPPSAGQGLIVANSDDNDDTLGSSGAAPDVNNKSSFSGAPDGNKTQSSTAPSKTFSKVGKCNRYDDDPFSSCATKIDGWVSSAPAPLVEDMICAPIVRIERMLKQFKANLPPPEYLFCVTAERKNCDIYGPWKKKNLDEMGTVTRCFVPSTKMYDLHFSSVLLKINAKASQNQHGRKHKQPISSSAPADSSGTMSTADPFPSMASSTPLTITISMPLKHHNASISSPLVVCGADATGTRESPTYQIVDMYCVLEDDWLGHKVGSFFSRDDSVGLRDARSRCMACTKGFYPRDLFSWSKRKEGCKLSLATGGHDMKLGRLPVEVASLRHCTGMLSHLTSSNPNVPNCTEGVISHAKIKDIKAMEKRHPESRKGLLKSQADTTFKQKEHKLASQINGGLAICHKETATLKANRSLCKLLMADGEGGLSDYLWCRMLRPDCAKACYRQATALMLLKEYKQACDALLDAQKWDPGNAGIKSELRKARELMKNPPLDAAY